MIYQDDLGGVDETGMGGKRAPSELAKSTSVVGLNSNGKMSHMVLIVVSGFSKTETLMFL